VHLTSLQMRLSERMVFKIIKKMQQQYEGIITEL
jgi:hypothetical protein